MKTYKNLKELKKAYDSGELSKDNPLTLDNDSAYVYVGDVRVYKSEEPPDCEILHQALNMLGIPHEGA